jgi:hypothetical protein
MASVNGAYAPEDRKSARAATITAVSAVPVRASPRSRLA